MSHTPPTTLQTASEAHRVQQQSWQLHLHQRRYLPKEHNTSHFIHTLCLKKVSPNIFDCNLKTNCQILKIIFGTNIPGTTCCQITNQFPTSQNVCFCTT